MGKFLRVEEVNVELVNIFEQAKEQIIIISPFIKLHPRIKNSLKKHLENPKVKITVVFGKNEENKSKSFRKEEFEFFKKFPNIKIKYESGLHAKYYANETSGLLSSMNLYEYSQNNNIEFGILTTSSLLSSVTNIGNALDKDASKYFRSVIENSMTKFERVPRFNQKAMGLTTKYSHSEIVEDKLSSEFNTNTASRKKSIFQPKSKPSRAGYCIRTGVEIPFNPKRPFSNKAFESWNKFKDENYSEKYCHFSGEKSDGETSFSKPILRKNWKKSQG